MSDSEDKLGFLFPDVARFCSIVFDDFMQAFDLTQAQWWTLANLYRHDGLTQRDLAKRLEIGAVTVSGLIDRLEDQGWVERRDVRNQALIAVNRWQGLSREREPGGSDPVEIV